MSAFVSSASYDRPEMLPQNMELFEHITRDVDNSEYLKTYPCDTERYSDVVETKFGYDIVGIGCDIRDEEFMYRRTADGVYLMPSNLETLVRLRTFADRLSLDVLRHHTYLWHDNFHLFSDFEETGCLRVRNDHFPRQISSLKFGKPHMVRLNLTPRLIRIKGLYSMYLSAMYIKK